MVVSFQTKATEAGPSFQVLLEIQTEDMEASGPEIEKSGTPIPSY